MNSNIFITLHKEYKFYLLSLLISSLVAISFGLLLAPDYEASFEIKLSKITYVTGGPTKSYNTIITPPIQSVRKLLLKPDEISQETLSSCGYLTSNQDRKRLSKALEAQRVDPLGEILRVVLRSTSKDLALTCAQALVQRILDYSEQEKLAELNKLEKLQILLVHATNPTLSRNILVSDKSVARPLQISLGIFFAMFLFFIFSKFFFKKFKWDLR